MKSASKIGLDKFRKINKLVIKKFKKIFSNFLNIFIIFIFHAFIVKKPGFIPNIQKIKNLKKAKRTRVYSQKPTISEWA